jgi:hypothetical protein
VNRTVVLAFVIAMPILASAQPFNPQDVRKSFVSDCVSKGLAKADDPDKTYRFCTCTFDTLATNLTLAEYLEIERADREGKNPQSLPQMQRVLPKLQQCK